MHEMRRAELYLSTKERVDYESVWIYGWKMIYN